MQTRNNDSSIASEKSGPARASSLAALSYGDFRALWLGQFISMTGSQMQMVAINWHVYVLTRSPLAIGAVGLVRVVPIILCSLIGGVVADATDRKHLIVATQMAMLTCAGVLAAVSAGGLNAVWPIYVITAVASAATAFENPARQALLPSLVPPEHFPNAVSLGMISFHVATICGPVAAGLLLARFGPSSVYLLNALSFIAVIIAVFRIRASGRAAVVESRTANRINLAALQDGLKFVWRTPIIVETMTLDFAATFFASATALLPIFAAEILHVGARGFGILAGSQAVGSVMAALLMARFGTLGHQGKTVITAVGVYALATIGFGFSKSFGFSLVMLALIGASDTVSTVLRQTIRQLITPDSLRGRMTSVNMMFFMGGPQLGEFEAGALARFVGAPLSVVLGGAGCLAAVILALVKARTLLTYDGSDPKPSPAEN
jgi:MFS family permease